MRIFDELMSDKENSIILHYIKMHLIGSSGLGKSTTRNRLIGLITNLASLPLEERKRFSTRLAESTQVLAVMDKDKSKLTLKVSGENDEETRMLFAYALSSKSTATKDTPPVPESSPESSGDHLMARARKTASEVSSKEPVEMPTRAPAIEEAGKSEESEQVTVTIVEVDKVVSRLRSIVGSGKYAEQLENKILLNLIDIGGQPGFIEMLPFLSKGPGMFLAFFRLDKDLDEPCEVSYERKEDEITPYKSIFTVRETLSQILSAISHHVTFDTSIDQELLTKMGDLASVEPVATLVGTFKDKLEEKVKIAALHAKLSTEFPEASESEREGLIVHALALQPSSDQSTVKGNTATVNSDMLSAVNQLLVSHSFIKEIKESLDCELVEKNKAVSTITCHFEDLLFHPADNQQFIALDNFRGTEADLDPLREHLQNMFDRFFKGAKLRIRPPQLLLGVALRKEYDIVSMRDCIHIGRALSMTEEEVKFSVWYLDRWVGALIYHPEIKDEDNWFEKYIICSPQVIFDSISSLIVETLLEFHSPKPSSRGLRFKPAEKKNWVEKGQFSLDTVKQCHSEENKKKVKEGKLIPVDKLVIFLEYSNLLSPITTKKNVGKKETEEIRYFIPAILECASLEELTKSPPPNADTPSPIKITFKTGYVPIGVFCAMISRLVSQGRNGILGMQWELVESGVKRNLVSFRVDDANHIVTLVAHVDCYEIRVVRKDKSISLHDLCSYVLSTMLYTMKEINSLARPIVAFDCQCGQHQSSSSNKLCRFSTGVSTCITCEKGNVSLKASQESWFAKVSVPSSIRVFT